MAAPKQGSSKKSTTGASAGGKTEGKVNRGTANPAFMKPLRPSTDLAAVVGADPLPRTEVTKRVWDHIKSNNLQDPKDKRTIVADAKLKKIFGKDSVTMFEMTKLVNQHLKDQ